MSDYGFKVSENGHGVGTVGILNQTFNSEKNCIKIATTGTVSGTGVQEVNHGFDFAPGFLVWYKSGDYWYYYPGAYSDENNLYISLSAGQTGYYAILADRGG